MRKFLIILLTLFLAAAILKISPARATMLFVGGEDVDFACTGACTVVTGGNPFRTAWARTSYNATSTNSAVDPPTNRFSTSTFTASSSAWFHWNYCHSNGGCGANSATNANVSNAQMIRVFDDAGNPTLTVRGTGTGGQLKISSRTSGGTFTDLVTCSSAFDNALTQLDLFVNYGASGEVTLYKNGAQTCTYVGDVTNGDGGTTLNKAEFANIANNTGIIGAYSEVMVSTTDTRNMGLLTAEPGANGNAVQWTGTNPCTVILPAVTINDASFIQSGTNDQIEQCTVKFGNGNAGLPAGTYRVNSFVMVGRVLRGATGPQSFNFVTRTGGTDYVSLDTALTVGFVNYRYQQDTNPATSADWATTDFTAAGFNIGLKSRP